MTEYSTSQFLSENFHQNLEKYVSQYVMFIDYVPLVGPLFNISHAMNLLWTIWQGQESTQADDEEEKATARVLREKGITAVVTALVDILILCLAVGVIAFVSHTMIKMEAFAPLRHLLILFILGNVIVIAVGLKMVGSQLAIHLTRQLVEVNHVSTSVVKSANITASAIEKLVETTNSTTNRIYCRVSYTKRIITYYTLMVILAPVNLVRLINFKMHIGIKQIKFQTAHFTRSALLGTSKLFRTIIRIFLKLFFIF